MTVATDEAFAACHMAVVMALQSVGQSTVNHRGRQARGQYRGVPVERLYLELRPAMTVPEWDRWDSNPRIWTTLALVLAHSGATAADLLLRICREYVRESALSQIKHDPEALRAWLREADRI